MKFRSPKAFARADHGMAAIETAMILPFMLLLFFGLLDLTGHISMSRKITAVANATADLVGQSRNSITTAEIQDYFKVAGLILKPMPDSNVRVRVMDYRLVSGVVQRQWLVENGLGPNCSAEPSTATMSDLMVAGNDVVVSQACSTYKPYLAEFMGKKVLGKLEFAVEQVISVRPRSSLTLDLK